MIDVCEPPPSTRRAPTDPELEHVLSRVTSMSPRAAQSAARRVTQFRIELGDRLEERSEPVLALVIDGIVRESYTSSDGRQHTRAIVRAGSWVGTAFEPAMFDLKIVAIKPARLAVIGARALDRLSSIDEEWRLLVQERLARAYADAIEREFRFFTLSPLEHYLWLRRSCPWLELAVPLYEIASLLRITPEHLSRLRRQLAQRRRASA